MPDWTWQPAAVDRLLAALDDAQAAVFVGPTGCGKTRMGVDLVARSPRRPALWVTHRRELLRQTAEAGRAAGLDVATLTSRTATGPWAFGALYGWPDLTVAMQATLYSRIERGHRFDDYELIVVDEAHHAEARTWRAVMDHWPNAQRALLTATPVRPNGGGLGRVARTLVEAISYSEAIERGCIMPIDQGNVWSWAVNLRGLGRDASGDIRMGGKHGAAERLDTPKRVSDCVAVWQQRAAGLPTICFASSVQHSLNIAERFTGEGVTAAHVDGKTPTDARDRIMERCRAGEITVLSGFGVLTEGFDWPQIQCVITERPTLLTGLFLQMMGRTLRYAEGKGPIVWIDPVNQFGTHGLPTVNRRWSLNPGQRERVKLPEEAGEASGEPAPPCSQCGLLTRERECPHCGHVRAQLDDQPASRGEWIGDGDLANMKDASLSGAAPIVTDPERGRWLSLKFRILNSGGTARAARAAWKRQTDEWPHPIWDLPIPSRLDPVLWARRAHKLVDALPVRNGMAFHLFRQAYGRPPCPEEVNELRGRQGDKA